MNDLNKKLLFATKRLLPDKARARGIRTYQRFLHALKYGDANFPRTMALEISVFCNRTCHYCPNTNNVTPKVFMTQTMFSLAITRLMEINWTGIVDYMFYGEPMADNRLEDFVTQTMWRLPKAKPRVITNGDYLTEQNLRSLINAGVINFSVSRHVPFNANWDKKINRLKNLYPDYITLQDMEGRTDLGNRGGAVEIKDYIPISTCDAPAVGLNILYNGDVILCCCDYKRAHPFGNIEKHGILEIWNNPEFVRQRKNVRVGIPEYDICRACFGQPLPPIPK